MSDSQDTEGLTVTLAEAAGILHVGIRQVHNHMAAGRIRSVKRGKRRLLDAGDVHRLADELDAGNREVQRTTAMVAHDEQLPASMQYLQQLQEQLALAHTRTGQLEQQLQMGLTPEDAQALRLQLAEAEGRAKVLAEQLARHQRPWWRKLLGV